MTTQQRNLIERIKDIVTTVSVTASLCGVILAFIWSVWAMPQVDQRIDCQVKPIADAVELQSLIMSEWAPDSVVAKAHTKYYRMKNMVKDGTK